MQIAGLDDIDNRIIHLLLKNGRASYSEIGAAVGLSRTAAKNRIRALETSGVIRGYQAILDPQAATGGMAFEAMNDAGAGKEHRDGGCPI